MSEAPVYVHAAPGTSMPDVGHLSPFRAVVIVSAVITDAWQAYVSDWLVASGCLYMMAWGRDCSSWDDAVDFANLEQFDFADIPKDRFVMTTSHAEESLEEVFWFCKNAAWHSTVELSRVLLLHIAEHGDEALMLRRFAEA